MSTNNRTPKKIDKQTNKGDEYYRSRLSLGFFMNDADPENAATTRSHPSNEEHTLKG